jgi:hypothetical protein
MLRVPILGESGELVDGMLRLDTECGDMRYGCGVDEVSESWKPHEVK